ncbi:hypothetical protein D9619_010005 [Psilocybe cf. subviscida]|uniref:EF-hand domain-containing protein n=1 Tax=Psilocybe cf. subviscida TaxID=2480587 RepID=A0A8H5F6V1_9AGAR|nr:hypothetical protein D9619_010005 [Psilocybe cf. subviscida]
MDDSVTFPLPITVSSPPDDSTIVGAINTTDTDELWDEFNKFYNKNEKAIEKCMKTDVRSIALGEKASEIELQIDTFSETTKVVLDGLAGLGKIHPIIGAAVVAFHAVISLDLSRRDNDRKVIAIMLEMQNMMCAMFQLRQLKHTHVQESERDAEKSRLHRLIESITADIYQCGSDLNYYLGQRFAFKLIKAKNFEQRFKTHVGNFATRRSELQNTITVYIAGGVDQANLTITEVSKKLDAVDSKLDYFFHAFLRKLDTPQEKEAFRFFDQNNGVENCISKDDLLARLLTMTGDVLPDSENKAELKADERIKKSRKVLSDEAHQNFEESLKQNTLRFDRLLTIQNNNHERVIAQLEKQEGYHKVTVSKLDKLLYYMHPDTKLNDPEVKRIWERMGLKTSVKAKNFVLTFRDHYQHDHSAPPTPNPLTSVPTPPPFVNGAQSLSLSTNFGQPNPSSPSEDPNGWLLEYIDVAHVRPIVEAMDADGSGFISVKEINTFARARPKEWSLLQWMVYWAAGWHINITQYRDKIYDILVQMHELLPSLHPANRVYVDEYLNGYSMDTIEGILRSTKSVTDGQQSQIAELAQFYTDTQETALRTNLKEVSYVISSVADATLVAGPARAESWIYPLLYLLLERHLAVLKLGRTQVFNHSEIYTHWVSLESVLSVFQQRKESLTAIFSQIYQNVAGRFETFAYGMFYAFYKEDTEQTPAKNTLIKARTKRSTRELLLEMRYKSDEEAVPPDNTILALEKGAPLEFEDLNVYENASANTDPDHVVHPVEGYWSVTFLDSDGDFFPILGLFHFVLTVAADGSITGSGESYVGRLKITGTSVPPEEGSSQSVELRMVVDNSEVDYLFHGTHNPERDVVTGSWEKVDRVQETPPEAPAEDTADGVQEGVSGEVAADTWPGTITPNDGDSEANESLEADVVTSEDNAQQTTVSDVSTDEVTTDDAPSAQDDAKTPTQIDTAAEDHQTSSTTESIVEDKQQVASNDSSTPGGTETVAENDQPQEITKVAEGSEDSTSEEDNDSEAEPAEDSQTSDDAVETAEGADDANEPEDEGPQALNTFSMRRTPAHMYRFRRNLNLDSETDSSVMAKNRWKFATEATKFQVQTKTFSWEYVRARFAERRLWLDLTVAFWQNLLPSDRIDVMCALTGEYAPSQSRLYETIANYLNPRGYPFKTGRSISCDYCGYAVVCDRYRCITCMKEDLSNQIDLCSDTPKCIENPCANPRHDFVHIPSHTLLRQKFFLHKIYYSGFIASECRTRSENIKKKFRALDEKKKIAKKTAKASKSGKSGQTSQMEEGTNVEPLFCVCCEKEVSLPCWICATCATDTAVCMECELKRAKIVRYEDRDNMHSHNHLLLRISDSVEVQSREVNNVRLQRELINITTDLRSLEKKVTTHLREASKVNTVLRRFTTDGEAKVIAEHHINDTPAVNGEVATPPIAQEAVNEDDDDLSDIFGSDYSSETESEALVSEPHSPLPVDPPALPVNTDAEANEQTEAAANSSEPETEASSESDAVQQEVPVTILQVVDQASMITPTPTSARFFESFTAEPVHSEPLENGGDLSTTTIVNGDTSTPKTELEAVPVEPPVPTKSRQLNNHLVSIDTRISSLDTRISSLDTRLSGVETQLGEILSLLRQIRS